MQKVLFVPDPKFFRQRGMEEIIYLPYDVRGALLTDGARPIPGERYVTYLRGVLPEHYMKAGSRRYRAGRIPSRSSVSVSSCAVVNLNAVMPAAIAASTFSGRSSV